MSNRNPLSNHILPIAVITLLAIGISMWGFKLLSSISSTTRDFQTQFVLSQVTERLDAIGETEFPKTSTELLASLRSSKIDWNSCSIEGDQILDGWGEAIRVTFDGSEGKWTLRSPGKDAEIGTEDDIEKSTTRFQTGESAPLD